MRSLFALAALATLNVASFASFELVLVADPVKNVIHRFDGTTGTYFGSFGKVNSPVWGNGTSMTILQSRNEVLVQQGLSIARYNYNTGDLLGTSALVNSAGTRILTTNLSVSRDGLSVFACDGSSNVYKYKADTLALTATYTPAGTSKFVSAAELSTSFFAVQDTSTAGSVFLRRLGTDLSLSPGTNLLSTQGGQFGIMPSLDISWWAGVSFKTMLSSFAMSGNIGFIGLNAANLQTTAYLPLPSYDLTLTAAKTTCAAHSGAYFGGTDAAGNNLIFKVDGGFTVQRSFGSGIIGGQVAMASVVAPEPGSLLAIGGALCALALRRRK